MKAFLFAAIAGLCWGVGEVFTKSVLHSKQIGPMTALAVRMLIATPLILIAAAIAVYRVRAEPTNWMQADRAVLLKLIFGSGLIAGAVALIAFYVALSLGEVSRVKPVAFAVAPATAVLIGWLVLKEPMTTKKALGVVSILVGVLLLTGK